METPSTKQQLVSAFGIGSIAGVMGSLAGMGGGFVMIPLLTSSRLVGLSQHTAHGTSLFAVAATGIAGAFGYGLNEVDLPAAAAIASFGIISARFGATFSRKLSGESLKRAFGGLMILVAPIVPAKTYFAEKYGQEKSSRLGDKGTDKKENNTDTKLHKLIPAGIIGIGSGFLAGLFGVGGGTVVVPALTVTTDLSHYQALSTSLLAMTLPALSGTFAHYQKGNVANRVALPLAIGSFIGAYAGGKFGSNVAEDKLRLGFSCLLVLLGAKSMLRI